MEYKGRPGKSYFKVVLVRVSAGEYVILKGPEEEKRLARVLQNDYNITKYEKMIQLLAMEMVQKEYREGFCSIFSIENISKGLKGGGVVQYTYKRKVCDTWETVHTKIYPRAWQGDELEEFVVYVICHKEECRCGKENVNGRRGWL